MGTWYTTREVVKAAADNKAAAVSDAQIDRLIDASSRHVERLCHRNFAPWTGTRYFAWPTLDGTTFATGLYLGESALISLTSITSDGDTISPSDVFLEPNADGPPYTRLELDERTTASFSGGAAQRNIAVTGLFGYQNDEIPAGAATVALSPTDTTLTVTNGAATNVGATLRIDSERLTVVGKTHVDTGADLAGDLAAQANAVTLTLTGDIGAQTGETLLVDGERMLVVDAAGTSVTVTRSVDGSTLAAHALGASVRAFRSLGVTRAALGTTAAAHADDAPIQRWLPPALVESLTIAETLNGLSQESSAYARVLGSGDNQREARGAGLMSLRKDTYDTHGRKARHWAV